MSDRATMETAVRASQPMLVARFGAALALSREGRDIKLREDGESQALIAAALRATSPLPILAEEGGWLDDPARADQPYWALDPLDGSYNYAAGVPLCCVSLALCRGTRPIMGCVLDFLRDEVFWGGRGLGLYVNGTAMTPAPPQDRFYATGIPSGTAVSPATGAALLAPLANYRKMRMIGSAALSLAWVAAGRFDAYAERGIRWWDVAGGLALVEAAGGVADIAGGEPLAPFDIAASRGGMEGSAVPA